jgi:threonine/homoserine/homoserine lactone efflux protein
MNSVLLTCLTIVAVIGVAYLIYMAIGMFLFNRAAKRQGVRRTIIEIRSTKKKKGKPKKTR